MKTPDLIKHSVQLFKDCNQVKWFRKQKGKNLSFGNFWSVSAVAQGEVVFCFSCFFFKVLIQSISFIYIKEGSGVFCCCPCPSPPLLFLFALGCGTIISSKVAVWFKQFYGYAAFAVDGEWSSWLPWGPCSESCGKGTQTRLRLCNNPPPSHDGSYCEGSDAQMQVCNKKRCPGKMHQIQRETWQTSCFHTLLNLYLI